MQNWDLERYFLGRFFWKLLQDERIKTEEGSCGSLETEPGIRRVPDVDGEKGRCEEEAESPKQSRQLWAPRGTTFVDLASPERHFSVLLPGQGSRRENGTNEKAECRAKRN